MSKLEIFIPARSGSQRIKNKNLQKINKKDSLLVNKIKTCKKISNTKIIVSTNSIKIKKIAQKNGAEVPFIRKKKYATSKASTISAILEYLRFLKENGKIIPEYLMILPVTNPFLKFESIKKSIKMLSHLKKNKKINSVLSYTVSSEHPFLYIDLNKNKIKFNLFQYKKKKYSTLERTQDWPKSYIGSPALKITRTKFFLRYIKNISPTFNLKTFDIKNSIGLYISRLENYDINNLPDLKFARFLINSKNFN